MTHPDGHSYGVREAPVSLGGLSLPRDWSACHGYLEGIDLFNRAFFWEAHEAWEGVWIAAGKTTIAGRYLQGLIQGSAALLKAHLGMRIGVRNLLVRSGRNLDLVEQWLQARDERRFMGIAIVPWRVAIARYAEGGSVVFPFLDPRHGE